MFYAHTLRDGRGHAHASMRRPLADLLKIAIGSMLALYGSTVHVVIYAVALSPGLISSFAVLHTEKFAFQYAAL